MNVSPAHMYVRYVHRGMKRLLDHLELKLWMILSSHVGAELMSSERATITLTTEPSFWSMYFLS